MRCRELLGEFGPVARYFTQQYRLTRVQLPISTKIEYELQAIARSKQVACLKVENVLPSSTRQRSASLSYCRALLSETFGAFGRD